MAILVLNMAIAIRTISKGTIHDSDCGSQDYSLNYKKMLRQHDFKVPMSDKGNCYDNAAVETIFKTLSRDITTQYPAERWSKLTWFGGLLFGHDARRKSQSSNSLTNSITHAAVTQHRVRKTTSLWNGSWIKRPHGPAQQRNMSTLTGAGISIVKISTAKTNSPNLPFTYGLGCWSSNRIAVIRCVTDFKWSLR